jgi:hypothetical protein
MALNIIPNPSGSVSFNGTNQSLSVPSTAAFSFGAGDFTMECWVYTTSLAATQQTIDLFSNASGSYIIGQCQISLLTTGAVAFAYATTVSAVTTLSTSASAVAINSWYHIAVVRSGSAVGNLKIYVNGLAAATSAGAVTQAVGTTGAVSIGRQTSNSSNFFVGYISNARIVNGVAVYIGNFAVPTAPLTGTQTAVGTGIATITNPASTTLLLQTPNNTSFISDSSVYAQTITNNNTAVTSALTPFTQQPISSTPTGSLFFSVAGLAVRYTNSQFAVGTGNFTAECWVWVSPSAGSTAGFLTSCSGSQSGFIIAKDVVGVTGAGGSGGAAINITGLVPTSTWTHMALVRNAGTLIIYINGVLAVTSVASSISMTNTTAALASRYADDTAYNFVGYITNARIVSGVAVYTGNFTVPAAPLAITQSAGSNISAITGSQTSLLCSTPNNASYLADSSNYNLTATVVGGTVSSNALTPFVVQTPSFSSTTNPLGSVSFNGSTQYLSTTNAGGFLGSGDSTVEAWVYLNVINTSPGSTPIGYEGNGATTDAWDFAVNSSGFLFMTYRAGTTTTVTASSNALTTGRWYHVAASRSGTTVSLFVNGALSGSGTVTSATPSTQLRIGWFDSSFSYYLNGYVSNFRTVKGVAVYTGTFTPSTQPLTGTQAAVLNTAAITNPASTSLLLQTPNNTSFITDSSIYSLTLTNNNTATASSLTPFSAANSSVWNGPALGAASFNGTTQYLIALKGATTVFKFDLGDFTIEAWFYWPGTAPNNTNQYTILSNVNTSDNTTWDIQYYNNNWRFSSWTPTFLQGSNSSFAGNTWNHIAVTRTSQVGQIWLNGVSVTGPVSFTTSLTTNLSPQVGYNGFNNVWNGYISNLRVVKGVGVYTGTFTPPTQPLAATQPAGTNISAITGTQTSLLLNFSNNVPIADTSTNGIAITNVAAVTTGPQTPFATAVGPVAGSYTNPSLGSLSFNGSTQYLSIPANTAAFSFGTGDFTMECWVYTTSLAATQQTIDLFSNATGSYIIGQCQLSLLTTGAVSFTYATTVSAITALSTSASAVATNSWYHIAVVRSGAATGNLKIYVNGIAAATSAGAVTQAIGSTGAGSIGRQTSNSTNFFAGYISNARIVNGVAVYTGTFTPPISPLTGTQAAGTNISAITNPANTSLLLQTPYTGGYITDSSVYNATLTNTLVPPSSLTPFTSFG